MTRRKINKVIIVMMLFANILNVIFANTLDDKIGIYSVYYHDDPISYVTYNNVRQKNYEYYYLDENNEENTVYCLNLGMPGAEENNGYKVSANEAISDPKISSIIANAYPYKSVQELGLETISEARFASQFAIWTYTNNLDLGKIISNDIAYERVVNAIKNIYNNGSSTEYKAVLPVQVFESSNSNFDIDKIDSNYYSKEYIISKNFNVQSISIKSNNKDVILANEKNEKIKFFLNQERFKVLVPVSSVRDNKDIELKIDYKLKENVSLLGISQVENMQNVALTLSPIRKGNITLNMNIRKKDTILKIKKVDKDNENIKIQGVKFKISDANNGKVYGEFVTDKNGEISLDTILDLNMQKETKLNIEEIEVPKEYYIDYENNIKQVDIKFGKINEVEFKNKKATGRVKIIKTSINYNELSNISSNKPLKNAKFAIYDLKGNKLEELVTNEEGIAISNNLVVGKYKIQEIEAPKYYKLNDKKVEFEISKNGEEIIINVKNDNIEVPKRLPNTGC